MSKEIPVLYQAEMVRAYLAGHKTQTRRLLSAPNCLVNGVGISQAKWRALDADDMEFVNGLSYGKIAISPRASAGDVLWGRETWLATNPCGPHHTYAYRATDANSYPDAVWRPSIFMPRAASRITQPLTGVRIERLKDITEADALAEGVDDGSNGLGVYNIEFKYDDWTAQKCYFNLWDHINGPGSADQNPWVLVYEFPTCGAANAGAEPREASASGNLLYDTRKNT
jgi:hypothetical protein